jgi:hypothetical protein
MLCFRDANRTVKRESRYQRALQAAWRTTAADRSSEENNQMCCWTLHDPVRVAVCTTNSPTSACFGNIVLLSTAVMCPDQLVPLTLHESRTGNPSAGLESCSRNIFYCKSRTRLIGPITLPCAMLFLHFPGVAIHSVRPCAHR